jgi:hypothetical protein
MECSSAGGVPAFAHGDLGGRVQLPLLGFRMWPGPIDGRARESPLARRGVAHQEATACAPEESPLIVSWSHGPGYGLPARAI